MAREQQQQHLILQLLNAQPFASLLVTGSKHYIQGIFGLVRTLMACSLRLL